MVVAGLGPNCGLDLLAGAMHLHPWLRGQLAESWKSYNTWRKATPHFYRTGVDENFLRAMARSATFSRIRIPRVPVGHGRGRNQTGGVACMAPATFAAT